MFRVIFVIGIFLISVFPSCYTFAVHTHNPSYVFEDHPSGKKGVNPRKSINVPFDLKGKTKAGKPLLIAIIDSNINTQAPRMQKLKKEGILHPAALALNNPYIVHENEDFGKYEKIIEQLQSKWLRLLGNSSGIRTPKEKNLIEQESAATKKLLDEYQEKHLALSLRKLHFNSLLKMDASNHGSAVIQAFHLVAPEAQILPIDLAVLLSDQKEFSHSQALTKSIREAIKLKVDVINLSRSLEDLDQEGFNAMEDAVRDGITVVISAGNNTNSLMLWYIRHYYDKVKNTFVKSNEQKIFERLKGKGIVFAGSTGIDSFGKEQVSDYSHHPEEDTKRNFLLAPGENLNIQANNDPKKLVKGTSFSAPVIAGALLVLKQHCLDKGYKVTADDLISTLYDSGRDIIYKRYWPFSDQTYKSVDAWKARQLADERFKPKPPAPVVVKLPMIPVKPTQTQPIVKPSVIPVKSTQPQSIVKPPVIPVKPTQPQPIVKPSVKAKTVSKPVKKRKALTAKKTRKNHVVKHKTVRPKKTPRKPVTNKKPISKKRVKSKK